MEALSSYEHIAWQRGWSREKYFGWTEIGCDTGLKILQKKIGPLERRLVMSKGHCVADVEDRLEKMDLLGPFSEVLWHDYSGVYLEDQGVGSRTWKRASNSERLLNAATFVVDLSLGDEKVLGKFRSNYRSEIKRALADGASTRFSTNPDGADLSTFFSLHAKMVSEKRLRSLEHALIRNMIAAGDAFVGIVQDREANILNANITYLCGKQAIFAHGASGSDRFVGSGKLLQLETMRILRERGVVWYDLGGVEQADENNGIYRFKKGFGGTFINLGTEYLWRGSLARAGRNMLNVSNRLVQALRAAAAKTGSD